MVCPCPVVACVWATVGTGVGWLVDCCCFPVGGCCEVPGCCVTCDDPFPRVCSGGVVCANAFITNRPMTTSRQARMAIMVSENRGVRRIFVGGVVGVGGTADS